LATPVYFLLVLKLFVTDEIYYSDEDTAISSLLGYLGGKSRVKKIVPH
jgi:hypothetical protein